MESLSGVRNGYAMSDDGRHVLFEATLQGGLNGAFLLSFEDSATARDRRSTMTSRRE